MARLTVRELKAVLSEFPDDAFVSIETDTERCVVTGASCTDETVNGKLVSVVTIWAVM